MHNVEVSFRDKWHTNRDLAFEETPREVSDIFSRILNRNGWGDSAALVAFLRDKRRVRDAECGNGRVTALLRHYSVQETAEIVGVELVAADMAAANLAEYDNLRFETRDLLSELDDLGTFNFIYSQDVHYHTEEPPRAFLNHCSRIDVGGEIAIYVYKQKAPTREFVDDFVRGVIAPLSYDRAMRIREQIKEFGRALGESIARIRVPGVNVWVSKRASTTCSA